MTGDNFRSWPCFVLLFWSESPSLRASVSGDEANTHKSAHLVASVEVVDALWVVMLVVVRIRLVPHAFNVSFKAVQGKKHPHWIVMSAGLRLQNTDQTFTQWSMFSSSFAFHRPQAKCQSEFGWRSNFLTKMLSLRWKLRSKESIRNLSWNQNFWSENLLNWQW